jgi:hypothetical protein
MNHKRTTYACQRPPRYPLAFGISILVAACNPQNAANENDAGSQGGQPSGGTTADAGSGPLGGQASGGAQSAVPLYLIATSFSAGDQRETYLVTSPSFDEETTFNTTDGPKLLGGVVPVVHGGAVYVPDPNSPVLIRYDVGANDKLVEGARLSFAGVGMSEIDSWHVYIVSDKKAYVFDPTGGRVVIWNPATMQLAGKEIDMSQVFRKGYKAVMDMEPAAGPKWRGSQLIAPLAWIDQDFNSRHASGFVVLDTEADKVVAVGDDGRCGESFSLIEDAGGNIYFLPPDWSALPHFFGDFGSTCVLRLPQGKSKFDPDYSLDLSAAGTGSAAAGAVPDGRGGFFFIGLDEDLWNDGDGSADGYWRFFHYDFETDLSEEVRSMPLFSHHSYAAAVGEQTIIPRSWSTDRGSRTTVYAVTGASAPNELFSFDADWYGFARIR